MMSNMFKLIQTSAAVLAFTVATSASATNFAVADSQAAFQASDMAKKMTESLNASLKPQVDRQKAILKERADIKARLDRDAKILSEADTKKLISDYNGKEPELRSLEEGIQRRLADAQANLSKTMVPKMQEVIEQIRVEGNYDAILEKAGTLGVSPALDITKKITDRLNASK